MINANWRKSHQREMQHLEAVGNIPTCYLRQCDYDKVIPYYVFVFYFWFDRFLSTLLAHTGNRNRNNYFTGLFKSLQIYLRCRQLLPRNSNGSIQWLLLLMAKRHSYLMMTREQIIWKPCPGQVIIGEHDGYFH